MEEKQIEQKPSIKIIRNTKGYNYEVKILSLDVDEIRKVTNKIEEVYKINDS